MQEKCDSAPTSPSFRYFKLNSSWKLKETRPLESIETNSYFYDQYVNQFATGDILLIDGIGLISCVNKIYSNSTYSNLGMILKISFFNLKSTWIQPGIFLNFFYLPNKWTQKDELYLLEITRNIDHFIDVTCDIFKLNSSWTGVQRNTNDWNMHI